MSHFSETLRAIIARDSELTQEAVAERSQVARSIISRMMRGKYTPTRKQLAAICAAISSEQRTRVELALSHLRDEIELCHGTAGFDNRHYRVESIDTEPDASTGHWFEALPPRLQVELQLIVDEAKRTPEMREVIKAWASACERYQQTKVYPFPSADDDKAVTEEPPEKSLRKLPSRDTSTGVATKGTSHTQAADQLLAGASRKARSAASIDRTDSTSEGSKNRNA